jgi:hypothetical protein
METQTRCLRFSLGVVQSPPRRRAEDIDCCTATYEAACPRILSPALKNIM